MEYPELFPCFDMTSVDRNREMVARGIKFPRAVCTSNTIVGVTFNDGVILASDTKVLLSDITDSSNTEKLLLLHDNIVCAGCGILGDVTKVMRLTQAQIRLHHRKTNERRVLIVAAKNLLKNTVSEYANIMRGSYMIAGIDKTGTNLCTIHSDGTTEYSDFHSIGTGQYAAMGVLERRWVPNMKEDDARELVYDAVTCGIIADENSGDNVDMCIIRMNYSVERCYEAVGRPLVRKAPEPIPELACKRIMKMVSETVEMLPAPRRRQHADVPVFIIPQNKIIKGPCRRNRPRNADSTSSTDAASTSSTDAASSSTSSSSQPIANPERPSVTDTSDDDYEPPPKKRRLSAPY